MTIKHIKIIITCISIFVFAPPLLAVEDKDELYPTIGKKGGRAAIIEKEEKTDKFKLGLSASVVGGYDTNVKLKHYDPVSSVFAQTAFGARGSYVLSDFFTLRGSYNLISIKYFRFSEPDLLDNIIRTGLDTKIADDFLWYIDYAVDFVRFPSDKDNEYTVNEIETGLRQDISDRLYQKIIYRFSHKHYPKRKTRNRGGAFRLGDREDTRNTFEHQLGLCLTDRTFIETENSIYFNNSNELYLDYYDYASVKTKAGVVHLITDKLYGSANAGYQYKTYKNRSASGSSKDQADHLLMCGTSIFYDITPMLSIGTNFDYRKNFSNEGEQKYTDYIISNGLYARF